MSYQKARDDEEIRIPALVWCNSIQQVSAIVSVKTLPDFIKLRLKFGYFFDAPFLSPRDLEGCNWVKHLVNEMLKNDEVAFRTRTSAINFMKVCNECTDKDINLARMKVREGKRNVQVCSLPIGLPFDRYENVMKLYLPLMELPPFETCFMLRIDTLAVGESHKMCKRFHAFRDHIEYETPSRGMIVFLQVILIEGSVSMSFGGAIMEEKIKIEKCADEVNEKYKNTKWKPIVICYGLPGQPELEPFYVDMAYMRSFGIDDTSLEKEFLLFQTDSSPKRLVFVPFAGCNAQMREAKLMKDEIHNLTNIIEGRFFGPVEEQYKDMHSMTANMDVKVSFMKEFLMKMVLFAADCLVYVDLMEKLNIKPAEIESVLGRTISYQPNLTLAIDYEGTLVDRPKGLTHEVQLAPKTKEVLIRLSHLPKIEIIIMGTKSVEELYNAIGIDGISYVGNFGLQGRYKDGDTWDFCSGTVNSALLNKKIDMVNELHKNTVKFGATVMDYGSIIVFLSRGAPPVFSRALIEYAGKLAAVHKFTTMKWRDGLLISLHSEMNKGVGLERTMEHLYGSLWASQSWVVVIGDAVYDEKAAVYLREKGANVIMLRVMKGYTPKTMATLRFSNSTCVLTFLTWLDEKYSKMKT